MIEMLCIFLIMVVVVESILLYGLVKQSKIERRLIVRLLIQVGKNGATK